MEFFGILILYFIASAIWGAVTSGSEKKSITRRIGQLAVMGKYESIEVDGEAMEVLAISMKGIVPSACSESCVGILQIYCEGKLVQSLYPDFQEMGTLAFEHRIDTDDGPLIFAEDLYWDNWVSLTSIPAFALLPPRGGDQSITLKLSLASFPVGEITQDNFPSFKNGRMNSSCQVMYSVNSRPIRVSFEARSGYLDVEEGASHSAVEAIRLGMAMAKIDGSISPLEAGIIKKWAKKHSASSSNPREEKNKINSALRQAVSDANSGNLTVESSLHELNDVGSRVSRMAALELCSEILAADGDADPAELKLFYKMIKVLDVDEKEARAFLEKHIASGSIEVTNAAANYQILGISLDMSQQEIKKILTSEFRKWSGRSSHTDKKIKDQASSMLMLIGKARSELLD
jgi:hypothetical protein